MTTQDFEPLFKVVEVASNSEAGFGPRTHASKDAWSEKLRSLQHGSRPPKLPHGESEPL
jgi:hypothetical protein